jgi:hypothetical protein
VSPSLTEDVVALQRLHAAYADVVTRRAWPELANLLRPGCVLTLDLVTSPARTFTGATAIGEFIAASIERFDHFEFTLLNSVFDVDVDAGRAAGRMYLAEVRHERDTGVWSTAYGLYQDEYERADGRWRFADRRYRSLARTGPDEAILGIPPGLPPLGQG